MPGRTAGRTPDGSPCPSLALRSALSCCFGVRSAETGHGNLLQPLLGWPVLRAGHQRLAEVCA